MPATVVEDLMDLSHNAESSTSSSSYRIYSTDDHGSLRASHPNQEGEVLLQVAATQKNAVHKMAKGTLSNGVAILALARQSGRIDIVSCSQGKKLLSIVIEGMRENIHRWVGLAIGSDCIYSCTSAGLISQTKLDISSDGKVSRNGGSFRSLPEPLQCCEFEPKSEPRFFAYGGEDVALSVNDVGKFFSPIDGDNEESHDENHDENHGEADRAGEGDQEGAYQGESSKTKKRRRAVERRAKARELMWGEIWRAKNLPADELKLAVPASIVSVAFLEDTKLVVGTKHGMLRLYEVGPIRKAVKQIGLFRPKVAPAKHLVCSHNDGQLVAADTTGRVYVVDWRTGTLLYKYEVFAGAVISLCSLPPPRDSNQAAYLVTASAEKLLRLHTMPVNTNLLRKTKENGKIESVQFHVKGVRNLLWDGVVPGATSLSVGDAVGEDVSEDPASNGQDDIWQNMATVGEEERIDEHRSQRRRT